MGGSRPTVAVPNSETTIVELLVAFRGFAVGHYQKNGKPTRSLGNLDDAIRPLKMLYGRELVKAFGPKKLKAVRHLLVTGFTDSKGKKRPPLARKTINKRVGITKQVFKWGTSEELVPANVFHALQSVVGLQRGRTEAAETKPIEPAGRDLVDATLPHLPPVVAAMVRFQRLTGCRPGEVCIVRPCDVDRSGDVWQYRPESHKTEHRGRDRAIFIGPKVQEVLGPYLLRAADAYCFPPAESERKRLEQKHAARKTPLSCGNRPGSHRVSKPKRHAGRRYDANGYARAVLRGCDLADRAAHEADEAIPADERIVPRWSPNQLRHTAATEIRQRFGLEAAQVVLGHSRADVTQVYAERDQGLAAKIMREIG